jgi:hypothetical protein
VCVCGGGQSAQEAVLVYPSAAGGIPHDACAHLFGLLNISQKGLELMSGGSGSPPVFSV